MQVSEVMSPGIQKVQVTDSIKRAAAIMREMDIGSLPVFDEDGPVGFVTDRDIVISCLAEGQGPDEPVSSAMNDELFFVNEKDEVEAATQLMRDKQIQRVLVMGGEKQPVGMLSLQDIADIDRDVISSIKQ